MENVDTTLNENVDTRMGGSTETIATETTDRVVTDSDATGTDTTQTETPQNVLLGSIAYTNDDDYEAFLNNLDVNQALFVLITSANYAQARGLYKLEESELVTKAIRVIKKTSKENTAE